MEIFNKIENQINEYLEELKEFEKLTDKELVQSEDFKDLLNIHIRYFIESVLFLEDIFNRRCRYFSELTYNKAIKEEIKDINKLIIETYNLINLSKVKLLNNTNKKHYSQAENELKPLVNKLIDNKNFNINDIQDNVDNFYKLLSDPITLTLNRDICKYFLDCLKDIRTFFFLCDCAGYIQKKELFNNFEYNYVSSFYEIEKALTIFPKLYYIEQFITLNDFCTHKKNLSHKEAKKLLIATKRVLKEFKHAALIQKSIKLKILSDQGRIILNKEDIQFQPKQIKLISILASTPRNPIKPEILTKEIGTLKDNLKSYVSIINNKILTIFPNLKFIKNQSGYGYYLNFEPEEVKIIKDNLL